jgi:hypothetical protein
MDTCTLSSATRETAYIFPLMLHSDGGLSSVNLIERQNFTPAFLKNFGEPKLKFDYTTCSTGKSLGVRNIQLHIRSFE